MKAPTASALKRNEKKLANAVRRLGKAQRAFAILGHKNEADQLAAMLKKVSRLAK